MTTIAFKDGLMAADSQATEVTTVSRVQKLYRLPDGGVVAFCGEAQKGYIGAKWLADGEQGEPPDVSGACFLIARPDGSLWNAEGVFPAYPILGTVAADGCGKDKALMAMSQGMSAADAVLEACKMDAYSSGPVYVMEVCQTHVYPGPRLVEPARKRPKP